MIYVIITGAHFFPYAWYYNVKAYAIMGGVISVGAMAAGLIVPTENTFMVPLFMVASLIILAVWIWITYKRNAALFSDAFDGRQASAQQTH